ncbi:MAG TPA: protein-L-isoaspartate O-methyltransferase, partial [Elusimicrobia bacterium]|nr:protein-L-isoaspartate O-methyltransferase [Elusimicrobiota bacterium]
MKKIFLLFLLIFFNFKLTATAKKKEDYLALRKRMVQEQIIARGIKNKKVISAMLKVPRHEFIPEKYHKIYDPYGDYPVPIGEGQTISQPYIVALMTELLTGKTRNTRNGKRKKILEIGTGSGYQAAILAEIYPQVYTIEIIESLAKQAERNLKRLGYQRVKVKCGDGYLGWQEYAPFDGIIVTCAPDHIPKPLIEQLKEDGRMVIPVGEYPNQILYLVEKRKGQIEKKATIPVLFVPMTGE